MAQAEWVACREALVVAATSEGHRVTEALVAMAALEGQMVMEALVVAASEVQTVTEAQVATISEARREDLREPLKMADAETGPTTKAVQSIRIV